MDNKEKEYVAWYIRQAQSINDCSEFSSALKHFRNIWENKIDRNNSSEASSKDKINFSSDGCEVLNPTFPTHRSILIKRIKQYKASQSAIAML